MLVITFPIKKTYYDSLQSSFVRDFPRQIFTPDYVRIKHFKTFFWKHDK